MNRILIARELIKIARLLFGYVTNKYGAWVTNKGQIIYVSNDMGHLRVVEESFPIKKRTYYEPAFEAGWIRLVNGSYALHINFSSNVSWKARDEVRDIILEGKFPSFYLENVDTGRYKETVDMDEAVNFIKT